MTILEIKQLHKSYNVNTPVLRGISVKIEEGEFVGIIGRSGSGKSTLLRCINRLILYSLVTILFLYQGWLGWQIRRRRKGNKAPQATFIRRHRKFGPILVLVGLVGFSSGLVLIYLDFGRIAKFPLHLATGSVIGLLLVTTFAISKKIRFSQPDWRLAHFLLGLSILCLYLVQLFLGLNVLL